MTVYDKRTSVTLLRYNMRAGEVEKVGNSCSDYSRFTMGNHIQKN